MNMPKIGCRFFDKAIGNRTRPGVDRITEVEVVKSGRKYFTCVPVDGKYKTETEYYIQDGTIRQRTNYCPDHALYASLQAILDQEDLASIQYFFRFKVFDASFPRLSLDALRKMKVIADAELPPAGSP